MLLPHTSAPDVSPDFDWFGAVSTERRFPSEVGGAEGDRRDPFDRDRARIIHSSAFRRLQGKSQIFAAGWSGFLRTRVTHAMEVAQIARAIATNHGLPGSLAEAAALAHDLGHPPFGHNGEEALNRCMADYGGFEGNAQTYRILTRLEPFTTRHPGVNVTRSTLLGVLKYPGGRAGRPALYADDVHDDAGWLYRGLTPGEPPSVSDFSAALPRSIICQIMDWADDIAYSLHDLEDGLSSGLLSPLSLGTAEVLERVLARARAGGAALADLGTGEVEAVLRGLYHRLNDGYHVVPSTARVREVEASYVHRFVTETAIVPDPRWPGQFGFRVEVQERLRRECAVLKAITQELILRDQRTGVYARQAVRTVTELFELLLDMALGDLDSIQASALPRAVRLMLEASEGEAARARVICDFIADMTDAQATQYHERLFSARQGSPFAPL